MQLTKILALYLHNINVPVLFILLRDCTMFTTQRSIALQDNSWLISA